MKTTIQQDLRILVKLTRRGMKNAAQDKLDQIKAKLYVRV